MVSDPSITLSRVFSSKGKGVPFEPTEDAVSPAVHSLTGARIVHSLSSSQPQIQPRSSSGVEKERADFLKDEYFLTDNFYEYEQGQAEILVKDRLRKNVGFWRNIGASQFVLDTITNGYVIPFYSTPDSAICRNNNSALRNKLFVQEAITDLEKKRPHLKVL